MSAGFNVAFLAYREWAMRVMECVKRHPAVATLTHYDNTNEFVMGVEGSTKPDIVLLCGWSDDPVAELVNVIPTFGVHCAESDEYSGGTPLQNQIIDGLKITKHRLFRVGYPELSLREYSHEVPLDLMGNMDDILQQLEVTAKMLFNMFLNEYPDVSWRKWEKIVDRKPKRKPLDSRVTNTAFVSWTTEQLYNFMRALEDPYPNAYLEDENGILYFERVGFKRKLRDVPIIEQPVQRSPRSGSR